MSGWTTKPRKPGTGCHGCSEPRGTIPQALIGRPTAGHAIWLCTRCAKVATRRQDFVDEYARRCALTSVAASAPRMGPQPEVPRRRRDEL